jgi:hypothetical protein
VAIVEGRRPVRASQSVTDGRAANLIASRRSNSGTVIRSSPAIRSNAAYIVVDVADPNRLRHTRIVSCEST